MAIRVRELRDGEISEVASLWRRSRFDARPEFEERQGHSPEEDVDHFRTVLAVECSVWVAEVDGKVVAFLATKPGRLDRLYVEPAEQGRGVGSLLLEKAKADQPGGLWLSTHQSNMRARQFYEARGFRTVAFGVSPPPENEPDVTYEWSGQGDEPVA